jgi:hypothetical protein
MDKNVFSPTGCRATLNPTEQKKRGSLSRVKSTPKEEGGGDKSELENLSLLSHRSSYASHSARTAPSKQEVFVHRTTNKQISTSAMLI